MFRPFLLALLVAGTASAYRPCGPGQNEMSVEGVEGVFCVDGSRICIANVYDGSCPKPQDGLPNGAYCGIVRTGVYGCKTNITPVPTMPASTAPPTTTPAPATTTPAPVATTSAPVATTPTPVTTSTPTPVSTDGSQCASGHFEMSVEGVPGIFCLAKGPICMADLSTGTCPGPQFGLPNGAYCGKVKSGVYGCMPYLSAPPATSAPGPATTTPAPATTTSAPVATTAAPPATSATPSGPPKPVPTDGSQCASGEYEMSVEGVPGVFCLAKGPICSADISTGTCPGPQYGLPNGAYCGKVKSGVYGCLPNLSGTPSTTTPVPATTTTTPAATTTAPVATTVAPPVTSAPATSATPSGPPKPVPTDGSQCARNEYEMSVEGVPGIFCLAKGPICSADISTGTCPGPQYGLPNGAYCGKVKSGVYGCLPNLSSTPATTAPAPATSTPAPPAYTTAAPVATTAAPTVTPSPATSAPASTSAAPSGPGRVCGQGAVPMSVEGVQTIFCVSEPACVQFRSNGNCPGPQSGLASGSYCGVIGNKGIYGCKPITNTAAPKRALRV